VSKRNRSYRWFVEPSGDYANQYIAKYLRVSEGDERQVSADRSEDGREHRVYECTYEELRTIKNSCADLSIKAHFWVQEGNGKFRKWKPEEIRAQSRRNRVQKQARRQLSLPFDSIIRGDMT